METNNTINGRTPEEIKRGLECCIIDDCNTCPYEESCFSEDKELGEEMSADALALINQLQEDKKRIIENAKVLSDAVKRLERERDAAVRTARWQFERRGKDGITESPVCSGCGATPKYYVPMNDVGMQVPPYCHECGSRMAPVVKMEVEK